MADLQTIQENIAKMKSMGASDDEIAVYSQGASANIQQQVPTNSAMAQPSFSPNPQPFSLGEMSPKSLKVGNMSFQAPTQQQPKQISDTQMKILNDISTTIQNLEDLKTMASEVDTSGKPKYKTGPTSYRFSQYPMSQAYMGMVGSPEEAKFKSTLVDTQSSYMTAKTGVQRGFKEIQWLEAAMPSPNLQPKAFVAVTDKSIERLKKNREVILQNLKKAGFDVLGFEDEKLTYFKSKYGIK